MLNNKKIIIMTKLALYEKKEGKEDIKANHFFKMDYVRLQIQKTLLSITLGYILMLLMIGAYKSEYIISKAVVLDYKQIGVYILGVYIIMITAYIFNVIIVYSLKYDKSRRRVAKYFKNLKILRNIYKEEREQIWGVI